ncbi:MAG: class A beta-lactamase-related serine hydrolase [Clostridiaceae bacterium]|jgi:beta-lactamase class A|nr:class A beta-lactamase-related serine hydrolase [Clostridiaceae bacterium]
MPRLANDYEIENNRYFDYYNNSTIPTRTEVHHQTDNGNNVRQFQAKRRIAADPKKVRINNFLHRLISISFVSLLGFTILPIGFNSVTKSFWRPSPYPDIKADYEQLINPTIDYLSNDWYLGKRLLADVNLKEPLMTPLKQGQELTGLEEQLTSLAALYPSIHSGIYVMDMDNGNYAAVNADESFATASIIKLPVLVQLFRSIEAGQVSLTDTMPLTEYYRSEGSGELQFKAANSTYTIDELARRMITDSDNSATNMLMSKIGSMTDVNAGIRDWGLANTFVKTWLPDMGGTNRTTAKDMATILYNLDNPKFLSDTSRSKIVEYMSHVKNTRLLKAGLPSGASLIHKTGDIGSMLGDAGIVTAPTGKRYIVVVLANRPHNSPLGKDFIVKASTMIYNSMAN